MKLLIKDNRILLHASNIVFGTFEDEEKWALYDDTGKIILYALDHEFESVTYDGVLPEDYDKYPDKYLYYDGTVIQDPDWKAPTPHMTDADRIAALENALDDLLKNVIPAILGE